MTAVPKKVKAGDFGLVPMGPGFAARSIRVAQLFNGDGFTDFEHAFVYVENNRIVEAAPSGARLSEFGYSNVLWSSDLITLTNRQRDEIASAAMRYVGTPYSFLDYLALTAHRLRINAPGLQEYVASSKHMICSQLVDQSYADAGVHLFTDNRWPGYVTPGMLAQLLYSKLVNCS